MNESLIAVGIFFLLAVGYILGSMLNYYIVQAYNVYKVYLMYWGERMKLGRDTLTQAWNCMDHDSPFSQSDNMVIIVLLWPLAVVHIIFMIPLRLLEAVWCRYVIPFYRKIKRKDYRLLPSWVSWSKLTEILNRTI